MAPFREKHLWFETQLDRIQIPWSRGHITLLVDRADLLESSVEKLLRATPPRKMRQWMRVGFAGETGVDVGGLEREFFSLAAQALLAPEAGLFLLTPGSAGYRIDPAGGGEFEGGCPVPGSGSVGFWSSEASLEKMEFAGRLLGKALLERQSLPALLTPSLLKHLLQAPLLLSADLAALDPELHRHLEWLLNQPAEVVDALDLDFTVTTAATSFYAMDHEAEGGAPSQKDRLPSFGGGAGGGGGGSGSGVELEGLGNPGQGGGKSGGEKSKLAAAKAAVPVVVYELVPGGASVPVTAANRLEYVRLLSQWHLGSGVAAPLSRLLEGFYTVVPPDLVTVFDYAELEFLLCGSQTVDVEDWRRHTDYHGDFARDGYGQPEEPNSSDDPEAGRGAAGGVQKLHPVCQWFWDAVEHELDEAERSLLFQFATGACRVPAQGFKALQRNDGKYQRFTLEPADPARMRVPGGRGAAAQAAAEAREGCLACHLPTSHTCFNRLDLPAIRSRGELREMLELLLAADVGGFDMA
mmetsp:Transcript_70314/g.159032  ORF Transcript_70314/g.159032 Transcript_70314/m.159032 type:complete len:524 (+) Transcript_70314:541-2112(+)